MKRKHPRTRWLLGICLIMALGALVLAGCGGSSGGSGSNSESSTTASSAGSGSSGSESSGSEAGKGGAGIMDISEEAKACLKEKGVELPEFKSGEGGPPGNGEKPEGSPPSGGGEQSEEMKKAFEECGVETPEPQGGASGEGGPPTMNSAAFKKQVKEYAACVRENGYEIASPNFSGEGPVFEKEESESATFKKASAQCQSLLGGTGPGASEEG